MSDIGGFPGLDRLFMFIHALAIILPSVLMGVVFLLLHRFVPNHGRRWTALYFVTGTLAVVGGLWWLAVGLEDSHAFDDAFPVALASCTGSYLLFLALRWLWRKVRRWMKRERA